MNETFTWQISGKIFDRSDWRNSAVFLDTLVGLREIVHTELSSRKIYKSFFTILDTFYEKLEQIWDSECLLT